MNNDNARDFALDKHKSQFRDDGETPFMNHPDQVAAMLRAAGANTSLIAAAYLHDTIEDTDTTYEELVEYFGTDVADLVHEVTDEGRADTHGKYFPRLKTRRGIMLKFADRLSNISDMNGWTEKRQAHYLRRSKFWKSEI